MSSNLIDKKAKKNSNKKKVKRTERMTFSNFILMSITLFIN